MGSQHQDTPSITRHNSAATRHLASPPPLLTTEAIRTSQDVIHHLACLRVVRVGLHFVVDYCAAVLFDPGQNPWSLSISHTTTVYALQLTHPQRTHASGQLHSLGSCWSDLDGAGKVDVAGKLGVQSSQLRRTPSRSYLGRVVGRRLLNNFVFLGR